MFSALFSFLGGSVFRMLWGEISSFLNKKQDYAHELELMRLQDELDESSHYRNIEGIRVQAELGIQLIREQAEGRVAEIETDAWLEATMDNGRSGRHGYGVVQGLLHKWRSE